MVRTLVRAAVGALVIGCLLVTLVASQAGATWSIVATDPETGEVGAALASCVPADALGDPSGPLVPVVLVPGTAAAVTQGQINLDAPSRISELVAAGESPADIVGDLASPEFDELAGLRQHAVVSVTGEAAAYSGSELGPEALDRQTVGLPTVSVQGNLLASSEVVTGALDSFETAWSSGSDLSSSLVAGLVAGAEAGGDRRCGEQTALFAHLAVAGPAAVDPADVTVLTVVVDEGDGQNPVELLAEWYAAGERGLVDVGAAPAGQGWVVRLAAFGAVAALAVGALVLVRRGFRQGTAFGSR